MVPRVQTILFHRARLTAALLLPVSFILRRQAPRLRKLATMNVTGAQTIKLRVASMTAQGFNAVAALYRDKHSASASAGNRARNCVIARLAIFLGSASTGRGVKSAADTRFVLTIGIVCISRRIM